MGTTLKHLNYLFRGMALSFYNKHTRTFLMGILLGSAGQVPGLTGSSVALGMGCYRRITDYLCQLWLYLWKKLKVQNYDQNEFPFPLLPLLTGVAVGATGGFWLAGWYLGGYTKFLWATVFGAVMVICLWQIGHLETRQRSIWFSFFAGILLILVADLAKPLPGSFGTIAPLFCGMLTAAVLFVPGISVTGLLLYLGCYAPLFAKDPVGLSPLTIGVFFAGLAIGLIFVSLIAGMLFRNYPKPFRAFLYGCLLMSTKSLWPWKDPIFKLDHYGNFMIGSHGQRVVSGYHGYFPDSMTIETLFILISIISGGVAVALVYRVQKKATRL